jgi:hypothetical protein
LEQQSDPAVASLARWARKYLSDPVRDPKSSSEWISHLPYLT